MKKFLITLDQFGSSQYLPIHPTNQHERSPLGGAMTLLLYGLSLAYFGYEIVDWLKNNKLPKITSLQEPNGSSEEQQSDSDILEFGFYVQDPEQANPFQSHALMFIPVVQILTESGQTHQQLELKNVTFGDAEYPMFVFPDLFLKRVSEASSVSYQDYAISLRLCQEKYLIKDQKCADSSLIDQFFQNPINWFVINTYISQYNTRTQRVEKIRKTTYINIQQNTEQQMQFEMEVTRVNIDKGFLLPSEKIEQYFSGYTIQQASLTREQSLKQWSEERYVTIYYTLAQLKTQVWIEFPKISEILADTGSIVTWILYLSLIVYKYNEYQSHLLSIEEIINTYYIDFKEFNFKKNIFGSFKSVSLNKKQYDTEKFQQLYNKLAETAGQKINFVNLTYELSRIQFLLSSLLGTENLIKMHQMGIKLEDQLESIVIKQQEQNHEPEDKKIMPADQLQSQDELNPQDLGNLKSNSEKDESIFKFSQEMYGFFMKPEECYTQVEKDQVKQIDSKEDKSFCKQSSMQLEQLEQ